MPARFTDGTHTLIVPAAPPKPALMMTLFVDGNDAWSVQGRWIWNPMTQSYYCAAIDSTVQCNGDGTFAGASGSPPTGYSGTYT